MASDNLLQLYMHMAGESEVPPDFHFWCAISLLASCVSDRVGFEKRKGRLLVPNLYVTLIGPSGCGKGEAIDTMLELMRGLRRVRYYRGRTTSQAITDALADVPSHNGASLGSSRMTLVTPEVAHQLGSGDIADATVKLLTDIYTGSADPLRDRTRTHGAVAASHVCMNWISGSTQDWLLETFKPSAISGGFFGRMVGVAADYVGKRYTRPLFPNDYDEVVEYLKARLHALTHVEGVFTMTPEAYRIDDAWYQGRPEPDDLALKPSWHRQHDLTIKLAMLVALADDSPLVIEAPHIRKAQELADIVLKNVPTIVMASRATPESKGLIAAANHIKKCREVSHAALLKALYGYEVNAERLRGIIATLLETRQISWHGGGGPGGIASRIYVWQGRRKMPVDPEC